MLASGFVDGRLIYIIEFPFNCKTFVEKLQTQLKKRFPDGDIAGQFLRSANFDYRSYIDCKDMKIIFLISKSELEKYRQNIVRDFYRFLWKAAPND